MEIPKYLQLSLLFLLLGLTSATTPSQPTSLPPPPCNSDDQNTLFQIKQAFDNSNVFDTWKPSTDCCIGWDFVICDSTTGHIRSFAFDGNTPWGRRDLPAIFPSVIGKLSHLTSLAYTNNATGPIPTSLANLLHLTYLDLSRNRLSGAIPSFITRFQNLSSLSLHDNKLTGTIPAQLSRLSSLNFLSLDSNKLTGRIPGGLFGLFKDENKQGVNLMLGSNRLTGPIPRSFDGVNIRLLELQNNKIEGDASFLFRKEKMIWFLDLSENRLSFNMSKVEVPSGIAYMKLNNNRIFGTLPAILAEKRMSTFNVSYNRLCGKIPKGWTIKKFGASAYSHNKCLCGTPLPPCKRSIDMN